MRSNSTSETEVSRDPAPCLIIQGDSCSVRLPQDFLNLPPVLRTKQATLSLDSVPCGTWLPEVMSLEIFQVSLWSLEGAISFL